MTVLLPTEECHECGGYRRKMAVEVTVIHRQIKESNYESCR